MKEKLNILLFYLVIAIVPYLLVSVMHGFTFNMNLWDVTTGMHYALSAICLFLLFLAKKLEL